MVVGQALPGGAGLLVGAEDVGSGRHPQSDRLGCRPGTGRRRSQEVSLGEDAGDLAALDHHDRPDPGALHPACRRPETMRRRR